MKGAGRTAGEAGEREVIRLIAKHLEKMDNPVLPFFDDVAAVPTRGDDLAVMKTDMLVWSTDVPEGMTPRQAARKAVVMATSDLASKGVRPVAYLISLGLPRDTPLETVREIASGLNGAARRHGAYVLGGDTNEAQEIVIDCAAFGTASRRNLLSRKGARPGHLVAVTGFFGEAAAGLRILQEGLKSRGASKKRFLNAILEPEARVELGVALAREGLLSASIDSSDGLAWSLHELAWMNRLGISLDTLPISPDLAEFASDNGLDPTELGLYGGEEFELVVTLRQEELARALDVASSVHGRLIPIGRVVKRGGVNLKVEGGGRIPVEPRGWIHFRSETVVKRPGRK